MNPINNNINPLVSNLSGLNQLKTPAQDQPSFKDFMLQSLDQVNEMQQQADQSVEKLFTGGDITPAEVLTAVQKADMSFRLMMQVRNKLMQAYQEIRDVRI